MDALFNLLETIPTINLTLKSHRPLHTFNSRDTFSVLAYAREIYKHVEILSLDLKKSLCKYNSNNGNAAIV
jgi:hypothetical protein